MLQTWIHRIKPEKEQRLREWLTEMQSRTDAVRESFAASGVRAEQAFVFSDGAGPLLVYVSEASDHEHAGRVYAASGLSIDAEHRQVMDECIERTITDGPLFDLSV